MKRACSESKSFFGTGYVISVAQHSQAVNLDRRPRNTVFRHLANIISIWRVPQDIPTCLKFHIASLSIPIPLLARATSGIPRGVYPCREVHRSITLYFSQYTQRTHRQRRVALDKASWLSASAIITSVRSHSSPHLVPPQLTDFADSADGHRCRRFNRFDKYQVCNVKTKIALI